MRYLLGILSLLLTAIGFAVGWWSHIHFGDSQWFLDSSSSSQSDHEHDREHQAEDAASQGEGSQIVKLTPAAMKNLKLKSQPVFPEMAWRYLDVPGAITDRPGYSDHRVSAPVESTVVRLHAFPGDSIRPGDKLITLNLFSETIQKSQSDLFKAARELELLSEQKKRLNAGVEQGAISASRLIEIENEVQRQNAVVDGLKQLLLSRGLPREALKKIAGGEFISTVEVTAPTWNGTASTNGLPLSQIDSTDIAYEVQELDVELGERVQAGDQVAVLSNHLNLLIEGTAFKQESFLISKAAENAWPIQAEFSDDSSDEWPVLDHPLVIHHLANSLDPDSRTLPFFIALTNQMRTYEKEGQEFTVWRFRPGQRVRLRVPIEQSSNVFVVPIQGVANEGTRTFVFVQDGELFHRIEVAIRHRDRLNVMIDSDGKLLPGSFVVQNAAAPLQRALKDQLQSGQPSNFHVHADGSVHSH